MTQNKPFQIDGALSPSAARPVHESLKDWISVKGDTLLDIEPGPVGPKLPGQVAIQLLISAARELMQHDTDMLRLSGDAQSVLAMTAPHQTSNSPAPHERSAS